MSAQKNIGIFWGTDFLSIAQTQRDQISFAGVIPRHFTTLPNQPDVRESAERENIHLVSSLQRLVRDQQINPRKIHLSVPTRDIIFRSFTMPAMSPAEAETAIMFEAPRYIPFKMDDLAFTYQTLPLIDKDTKRVQVLFVAMRKETLQRYCKVLSDAGLQAALAEPAALSLLRILSAKKLFKPTATIALIQVGGIHGSILIADGKFPQFIRDFNLFTIDNTVTDHDLNSYLTRLLNEIRLSFEFYSRQARMMGRGNAIDQIFIFADEHSGEIFQAIKTSFVSETLFVDINQIFTNDNELTQGLVNAVGASLSPIAPLPVHFNLLRSQKTGSARSVPGAGSQDLIDQEPNYKLTALIAGVCAVVIALSFLGPGLQAFQKEKELSSLRAFDQKYQHLSIDQLKQSIADIDQKIKDCRQLRFTTNISKYMEHIARSTVEGVWLTELSITPETMKETKTAQPQTGPLLTINIFGSSYHKSIDQQIVLIENFLDRLKTNSFLKKNAESIYLRQVKKEEQAGNPTTSFQISIKTDGQYD